jgi:hypothetical protein
MKITLQWLKPDDNVPRDLPPGLRGKPIVLNCFMARRHGIRFIAGWGVGYFEGGQVEVDALIMTTTGDAVFGRSLSVGEKIFRAKPSAILVDLKNPETAYGRVKAVLESAPKSSVVGFICKDDKVMDSCCVARLVEDPGIELVTCDGDVVKRRR